MKTGLPICAMGIFLVGCGGQDSAPPAVSPSPLVVHTEPAAPTPAPVPVPVGRTAASASPTTIPVINFLAMNNAVAGARPVPDCTPQGAGVRYDAGSASYATLNHIPWDKLLPDDVVCVPYRAQPYRNKISFITRGAAGHPIRLVGLRGPNGERPVIDGDQATTSPLITPAANDAYLQDFGLISFNYHFLKPVGAPWGWHPGFVTITGLKIQHASGQYAYTDAAGATRSYASFSSGVYINSGDNIVIEDSEINDNSLGIFANSHEPVSANSPGELTAQNITIRGNYIHSNGDTTHLGIHNVYVEAFGCNIIGNYFGHKVGNVGTNLKSRCSHERIYANYFSGGAQSLLMLVDPQSGWDPLGTQPDFEPTVVAGNLLENPFGASTYEAMVNFGGDGSTLPNQYRKTLLMVHNTIFDNRHGGRITLFSSLDSTHTGLLTSQWVANNLIVNQWDGTTGTSVDEFALASYDANVFLTTNWIASNVVKVGQYNTHHGSVTGWGAQLTGNNPMLMGTLLTDPRPAANSPLVDAATPFTSLPAASKASTVTDYALYEFTGTPSTPWFRKRVIKGAVADIGAYETP